MNEPRLLFLSLEILHKIQKKSEYVIVNEKVLTNLCLVIIVTEL